MHARLTREKVIRFIRVGYLLHIMMVGEILVLYVIYSQYLEFPMPGRSNFNFTNVLLAVYLFTFPVFAQLDARSRYQNYKKLRDQFHRYGYNDRILKPVLKSRCQRDAALIAASDTGFYSECARYFHKNGYRWYHLLPDFIFRTPWYIYYPAFWVTTFFVPPYRSNTDHLLLQKKINAGILSQVS